MEYKHGKLVRQQGKKQIMTMTGLPGIAASSGGGRPVVMQGSVICEWKDGRGRTISRSFTLLSLESVE